MNSRFHKAQAEGLIKEANRMRDRKPIYWHDNINPVLALAQVHATLATIPDEVDDEG